MFMAKLRPKDSKKGSFPKLESETRDSIFCFLPVADVVADSYKTFFANSRLGSFGSPFKSGLKLFYSEWQLEFMMI